MVVYCVYHVNNCVYYVFPEEGQHHIACTLDESPHDLLSLIDVPPGEGATESCMYH